MISKVRILVTSWRGGWLRRGMGEPSGPWQCHISWCGWWLPSIYTRKRPCALLLGYMCISTLFCAGYTTMNSFLLKKKKRILKTRKANQTSPFMIKILHCLEDEIQTARPSLIWLLQPLNSMSPPQRGCPDHLLKIAPPQSTLTALPCFIVILATITIWGNLVYIFIHQQIGG